MNDVGDDEVRADLHRDAMRRHHVVHRLLERLPKSSPPNSTSSSPTSDPAGQCPPPCLSLALPGSNSLSVHFVRRRVGIADEPRGQVHDDVLEVAVGLEHVRASPRRWLPGRRTVRVERDVRDHLVRVRAGLRVGAAVLVQERDFESLDAEARAGGREQARRSGWRRWRWRTAGGNGRGSPAARPPISAADTLTGLVPDPIWAGVCSQGTLWR